MEEDQCLAASYICIKPSLHGKTVVAHQGKPSGEAGVMEGGDPAALAGGRQALIGP